MTMAMIVVKGDDDDDDDDDGIDSRTHTCTDKL